MKTFLIFIFFKLLISQQTPQLCSKAAEYSNCARNATLKVAACNQNVDSNPDSAYYTCLCDGYLNTLKCYALCPDDPQLQLQFRTQKESTSSTCKAAGDMKMNEPFSSSSLVASSSSLVAPMSFTTLSSSISTVSSDATSSFGVKKSQTTSQILGVGGSTAMTPTTSTLGSFTFFSGSVGYHCSLPWIVLLVAF
jgi:hypothetical protein